jgi:tetratricopeptide (TPR) repeat protein
MSSHLASRISKSCVVKLRKSPVVTCDLQPRFKAPSVGNFEYSESHATTLRLIQNFLNIALLCCLLSSTAWATNYKQKAQHFEQQGQWTEARRAWQSALVQNSKNLNARYHLAQILEKAGHPSDAQALYEKNIQIGKHLNTTITLAQLYIHNGKRSDAIKLLKKATKVFRNEAVPWYLLAELAIQDKHLKQSQYYFKKSLKADPINAFAHLRYARFLSNQNKHSQAIKHAKKALRIKKTCAPCWRIYGDILEAANKPQDALQAYQQSLAIQPNNDARQHLINVLQQLGEHQRAKRMQQALDAWKKIHI